MRRKRDWVKIGLAVSVVLLLGWNGFLMIQSGTGAEALSRLWRSIAQLEGLQVLVSQLNIGWVSPEEAAQQWLARGAELEQAGRYHEAIEAYEQGINLAPDEVVLYLALASAYEALEENDRALAQVEKAAHIAPDDGIVQRHLGRLQCLREDYEVCVETLERAVEMNPDDALARYWLAGAYRWSADEDSDEALAQYEEALRIEPDLGEAHLGLGSLYLNQPGQEAVAIEEFRKALDVALATGDERLEEEARSGLAMLYYAQDNYTKCIDQWQQVLATDPDDTAALRRVGLCYAMRGHEGDLEQAIDAMEQALTVDFPFIDGYYYYLAQYYATERDYPRAVWAWEQFLRFSDNEEVNADVREWIGRHSE